MAKPKEQFLRNKDISDAALKMVTSPVFEQLMTFAKAEFAYKNPTAEQGRGAFMFEDILVGLPNSEAEETGWNEVTSGAGLNHDIHVPINHIPQPPTQQ